MLKNIALIILVAGAATAMVWAIIKQPSATTVSPATENYTISKTGIHYHPKLDIYIKGQLQTIPTNIGIGAVHLPIHTHAADHIIHLEFSRLVTLDDTRLQEFFKIWNKKFDANCIFDNCNGPSGTVKMFVNGQPNSEFEKYPMKNDDRIEIRYE
ncbi:MAG: hypothetical protein HYT15_04535 [Candidatus Magasanikbacteria bacterium]|nr:hypothetical protein [Candidatus Magasanikbacteria bacterium]